MNVMVLRWRRKIFADMSHAAEEIAETLKLGEEEYETAAVVLRTEKEAEHMWLLLKEILGEKGFDIKERLSYLDRNSTSFKKVLQLRHSIWQKVWNLIRYLQYFRRKTRARLCVRRDISLQQEPFMNCICMKWKNKKVIVTVHSVHSNK